MIWRRSRSSAPKKEKNTAVVQLLSVALVVLLIGIFAAFLITRQIILPLKDTVIAARRIADGDLTQGTSSTRQDELGLLQNTMLHMTVSLRGLIGGIGNGVTQIATAAEQLSAASEQTSAGVTLQKNEVDQVATAMDEMASTVQEVAHIQKTLRGVSSRPASVRHMGALWCSTPLRKLAS